MVERAFQERGNLNSCKQQYKPRKSWIYNHVSRSEFKPSFWNILFSIVNIQVMGHKANPLLAFQCFTEGPVTCYIWGHTHKHRKINVSSHMGYKQGRNLELLTNKAFKHPCVKNNKHSHISLLGYWPSACWRRTVWIAKVCSNRHRKVCHFFFLATVDYVFEEGVINTAHLDTHSSTPVLIFE